MTGPAEYRVFNNYFLSSVSGQNMFNGNRQYFCQFRNFLTRPAVNEKKKIHWKLTLCRTSVQPYHVVRLAILQKITIHQDDRKQ